MLADMLKEQRPALRRLREWRFRRALNQAELAEQSGVARTTIVRLEQGTPNVRPRTLRKLARALGVRPEELVGGDTKLGKPRIDQESTRGSQQISRSVGKRN